MKISNKTNRKLVRTTAICSMLVYLATFGYANFSYAGFTPQFDAGQLSDTLVVNNQGVFDQFVEYASFVGVSEREISRAIWEGRFSPAPADVERVYGELAIMTLRDLGATIRPNVEWFNQGNIKQLAKIFGMKVSDYLAIKDEKNRRIRQGWISRFGSLPDSFFDYMEKAGKPVSSREDYRKNVPLPAVISSNLGGSPTSWNEYARIRKEVYLPWLAGHMAGQGLTIETASIDNSVEGIKVDDFAYPELITAFIKKDASRFTQKPIIPLAYVMGIHESLNDQSALYLMENPRLFLRELDPGIGSKISKLLLTDGGAVSQTTKMSSNSIAEFFLKLGQTRREGGSLTQELQAMNGALGKPALSLKEAKEFGTRDGRALALLFDEDAEAFRAIYGGLIKFVREDF
ncbi:hypothetical protein SAMN06265368_2430 [Cohaesibacter gelatinilyticus]|uniref:Uncharacterized protein n=2 Tax=Cohaesibacter gelatinilyticus TaxID=372072 RepID=A0A285PDQ1_9HYPH|nr:hypothetical protein SAMN06265368_2430 [Cohaesibacter gelatinilyticus]